MANLLLSEKYKAFLRHDAPVEFLEGTTAAGKTTVGIFKFMLKVAQSPKKIHILSGLDLGTIEKNIINKELGIKDDFGDLVDYWPGGHGEFTLPHLEFHTSGGTKIIFVLGYDNKTRWKKALGGQYGCLYIDEINIADMEYVREVTMRCDYLMATLNPDDPGLPIYREYINCSRPLPEWAADTPKAIMDQLNQPHKPGWVHWFFSFDHNLGLTAEKKARIIENVPKGTNICYFVLDGMLQTTEQGSYKMAAFSDEHMARLYERFVLEYYKQHHTYLDEVKSAQVKWNLDEDADDAMIRFLPVMQTDIFLRHKEKTLIIDTKYYGKTMQKQYDSYTLHSNNLYQIFTYVKNHDRKNTGNVSGMLLYAKTQESITPDCVFPMGGNQISVKTLDLNLSFSSIAAQLDKIAENHFGVHT